jgi:nuclease HARBI1
MGVLGPDGIFYDIHTDTTGRHNDKKYANINNKLAILQNDMPIQYFVYGDKGFDSDSHTLAAYHGIYVTEAQRHANGLMTTARVAEEWEFGKLKTLCPLIKHKTCMHFRISPVLKVLSVAVLIANAHTCLAGSKTSEFFDCQPPPTHTLEE